MLYIVYPPPGKEGKGIKLSIFAQGGTLSKDRMEFYCSC